MVQRSYRGQVGRVNHDDKRSYAVVSSRLPGVTLETCPLHLEQSDVENPVCFHAQRQKRPSCLLMPC